MRTTISRLATILLLALGFTAGSAARADDEAKPRSAAEQAFKDAWWAETGGGNLNEALALYEKAAAAEGPGAVKAKALYRRAVIQQRIGKTQEAIQTLERLAKEHPGEAELQSDARARLEEWTAVDLRTGFPEWYRRFQYGPEFQAKILDLVLKLGANDHQSVWAARTELLTIGEPAIPALRAHLGTRNAGLANQVVDTLMMLGDVPDEIVVRLSTWVGAKESWALILDLPAERRAALVARMGTSPEGETAQTLHAALQGPKACVEFLARLPQPASNQGYPQTRWAMQAACLDRVEPKGALAERIRELAARGVPTAAVWQTFAYWLIQQGLVTRADVDAWARLPWEMAATTRIQAARDERLFQPAEGLQLLLDVIASRPNQDKQAEQSGRQLFDALALLLPSVPWPDSLDPVARALGQLWWQVYPYQAPALDDRMLEVLGRAFELARERHIVEACGSAWIGSASGRPGSLETLFRWAREGPTSRHRSMARQALAARIGEPDLDRALDLLVEPKTLDDDLLSAWQQLLRQSRHVAEILGSTPRLWRLLDRIAAVPASDRLWGDLLSQLYEPIVEGRAPIEPLMVLWLEQPERFPRGVLERSPGDLTKSLEKAGRLGTVRHGFRERWVSATPLQREGLLAGVAVLAPRADPDTLAFLREILSAKPPQVPEEWRNDLIVLLPSLSLEEVRAFYDLTQPAQVDAAAGWILDPSGPGNRSKLLPTPEAFEALRLAFRPDGPRAAELAILFASIESVQRPLLELLFAHSDEKARDKGVDILIRRSSPSDTDLWVKAVKDTQVQIRVKAAKHVDRATTPETLKALVAALDDPHPDVRAAALKSLDSIQKMEDLKARWREKVK